MSHGVCHVPTRRCGPRAGLSCARLGHATISLSHLFDDQEELVKNVTWLGEQGFPGHEGQPRPPASPLRLESGKPKSLPPEPL